MFRIPVKPRHEAVAILVVSLRILPLEPCSNHWPNQGDKDQNRAILPPENFPNKNINLHTIHLKLVYI
jgi:hypothetical protein